MKTNNLTEQRKAAIAVFNPNHPRGMEIAQAALQEAVGSYTGVAAGVKFHQARAHRSLYEDESPNISLRNEFTREIYGHFRPHERIPTKPRDIMSFSNQAYRRVGLVRNIIDLMGDFTVQGLRIVHPNKTQQRLYRAWWKKINGDRVAERFSNLLYRLGNVVVRRWTAKLPQSAERKMVAMGAKLDADIERDEELEIRKRVIPYRYNFLNPMTLEIAGGELGQFVGTQIIALKLPANLRQKINHPKDDLEKALVSKLPQDIKDASRGNKDYVILDQKKLAVAHYKKDDWQTWADPITYAAMDDLILLEKMKLADLAALDGAISQVRVWTLGDLEKGILPTDAAIEKLSDILLSNPGGGAFDLIWGPDLKVTDYKTDVHQFLGSTKYEPVLSSLYETYGVPATLTGNSNQSTTNNFIAMETLIQRLNYGRKVLVAFLEQEIELFRQAMGLQKGAKIVFDHMILSDKAAAQSLIKDMWDRNVISDETYIERMGEDADLELVRQRREERERKRNSRPPKAGPYFAPEKLHEYIKIALQRGYIHPEDAGIEDLTPDKKSPFDAQLEMMLKAKTAGGPGGGGKPPSTKTGSPSPSGRKKNSGDSGPRDQRTFKPRTSADYRSADESIDETAWFLTNMTWAKHAQEQISEFVNPALLKQFGKESMRQLSKDESAQAERIKFRILSQMEPYEEVNEKLLAEITANNKPIPRTFSKCKEAFVNQLRQRNGREPNMDEMRSVNAAVYSLLWETVN